MIRFLLDTNIVIALFDPQRRDGVLSQMMRYSPGEVATSIVVAHELYFGAFNSARPEENLGCFDEFLAEIVPLPLTLDDVRTAGQALARGVVLVSNNTREFSRVKNLQLVDWLT